MEFLSSFHAGSIPHYSLHRTSVAPSFEASVSNTMIAASWWAEENRWGLYYVGNSRAEQVVVPSSVTRCDVLLVSTYGIFSLECVNVTEIRSLGEIYFLGWMIFQKLRVHEYCREGRKFLNDWLNNGHYSALLIHYLPESREIVWITIVTVFLCA